MGILKPTSYLILTITWPYNPEIPLVFTFCGLPKYPKIEYSTRDPK